jgi:kumamolisin
MAKHPLQGSERSVAEGSTLVGNCNPAERIEVHVVLRRHAQARFDALLGKIEAGDPSVKPLSREAFAKEFGAAAEDIAKVKTFAAQSGLTVVREDPAARTVVLGGTIAQFQTAFDVELHHYEHHSIGQYRGRTGTISVPDDLSGIVTAVLGLDNRPQARPHFRIRPPIHASKAPRLPRCKSRRSTSSRKAMAAVSASALSNSAAAMRHPISIPISRALA